ncbi:ATP-citrate synthase alpha chain protein 2 [Pleodorina starrii]|uniref:ATP citrate synthase n=1 Tax=Pleodorina starrii TaxID=330485 RepID=A0A9W6C084_9CHLO|nr:ATP-citrate synthase alpha chain protein 2 [Pleodorina starrii]GLC61100.1 ATP-citrate synthase alpha chain protein 2 [Pleodorina starrii]GLC69569.1 ATP-citrate synthase alpha chain protein 2 [Pleodorina starrii]
MARKKIREYDAKRLLKAHIKRLAGLDLPIQVVQFTAATNPSDLLNENPWLGNTKLVVKPDMLFGQRGKNDLVGLNLDFSQAVDFATQRLNRTVTVNGCTGPITTFLIEPFVPHKEEFYLSITSSRNGWEVAFSEAGGIHIEENWDKLRTVSLDTLDGPLDSARVAPLMGGLPLEVKPALERFILAAFAVFDDLDCTLLEMNPWTLDASGQPFPLDMRVELDDTAKYRDAAKWNVGAGAGAELEFPLPFGRVLTSAEEAVSALDEATGASLKFTVLNPAGRVWLMVAGGGASVIYTDTIADLGFAQELGNYGEYSGAPNTSETYQYARTVLECATSHADGRGRALLIGGGIANFTDVAATFTGIIQALKEKKAALQAAKVRIFVRRGGPNYQKGLALMRSLGDELGVPISVYGPESSMTGICAEAIEVLKQQDGGAAAASTA